MNTITIQFTIFIIAIITGCEHDEPPDPGPYWGTASVLVNGEIKEFKPYCISNDSLINIYLDGLNDSHGRSFELVFGLIKKQQYKIDSLEAFNYSGVNKMEYTELYSIRGGDVLENVYIPLNPEENSLEVTDWNEIKQEIKGKFIVTFIPDPLFVNDSTATDTIRFVNGEFYTRIDQ